MHSSTIFSSVAVMLGLMAHSTIATIAYGKDDANEPIAWIYGETECDNVRIAGAGANPCNIDFTLDNGYTYYLQGCGGAGLSLFNSDGSFNANCAYSPANLNCGVQQQWTC